MNKMKVAGKGSFIAKLKAAREQGGVNNFPKKRKFYMLITI